MRRWFQSKEIEAEEAHVKEREGRSRARRYFFAGFFLSVLIAGIGFACLGVWPFGDKTVLIIDSLHQYLPFYTDMHNQLTKGGSLLYSFSGGLGYNFWSTYAYYLASPLNFLMVLVPTANVCDFMDLMILLKIGLCGGCFSWYLHRRDARSVFLPAAFGVVFALSNFVIGYYFNLMWLDSIAVLPLIMFGIERITEGKSGKLFCLSLFYGLWCNYYIGFMLCIFSCLYFLVCWISRKKITWGGVWRSCLNFGWHALLAGGMASLVLVPAFLGLSTSESMEGNTFPTVIKFYTSFVDMMKNHMAFLEPVNISNSQVGLNVYCGTFTVLLGILYLFDSKIRLRERLAHYGVCAFLLLSFSFNILNYIWHGFHVQNGLPNRFAFLYIAVLLVMAYDALRDIGSYHLWELLISWILPAAFVAYCFFVPDGESEIEDWVYYICFGLMFVYFGLQLLCRYGMMRRKALYGGLISGVLLVEAAANGIYGISCNGGVTRSIYIADQTSYQKLMAKEADDSFFRSEVDRQRMRNVTMYVGGHAMVMFNSTMHGSLIDLCDSLGIEARTNKNGYLGVTKLMNDVFGIRYLASPSNKADTMYQFKRIGEDGELTLYKNDQALSIGFLVNDAIRQWDIAAGEPLLVQNSFVELATGLEPIYVLDRYIDMADGENYGIKIPQNKQVYLCLDTRVEQIELNTPEYTKSFSDYTDHLYVINGTKDSDMADFTVTLKETQKGSTVRAEVYTCANDAYQKVVDRLSESQLTNVKVDGNHLSGTVDVKNEGTLLLTIPYDEGWTITVDGKETTYYSVGEALMGVHLTEGAHEIRMKFTPPGLKTGAVLSLICVLLYLLSSLWERRHPEIFRKGTYDFSEKGAIIEKAEKEGAQYSEVDMQNLVKALRKAVGEACILEREPMKNHTTFRIGGPADVFASPDTEEGIASVVRICREWKVPYYVIGNGSNLLVSDQGYRGVILQIYRNLNRITVNGEELSVQAGAMLSVIAKTALSEGLTGFEFASGIPGTIGGAAVMNAGAYGGEMKDVLTEVTVLTAEGEIRTVGVQELELGYRHSVIPERSWIVLGARLRLKKGDTGEIRSRMEALKEQRVAKQPLNLPSAGSTFKRPEGYFAGKLIMDAGLRGFTVGRAQVSEKHCGFVVNLGGATAEEVRSLIRAVQERVREHDGVELEPEIKMLGEFPESNTERDGKTEETGQKG